MPPPSDTWTERTLRSYLETTNNGQSPAPNNNETQTPSVGITGVIPKNANNVSETDPFKATATSKNKPSNSSSNVGLYLIWRVIKLMLLAFILLSPLLLDSLPLSFSLPSWLKADSGSGDGRIPSIHLWLPLLTLVLLGLPFANAFVRIIIWSLSTIGRTKDKQPSLARSRMRHFLSVSQKYVALFTYLCALTLYLNNMDLEYIFSLPPAIEENSVNVHVALNKFLIALILGTLLFAYKNYGVVAMAMAFNYANYIIRIRDILFADHMLMLLDEAARASYKMRKRLSASLQHRSETSRLAAIFESPRRALVSAGGWLKHNTKEPPDLPTTTPNASIPQSPTISFPEPAFVPQVSMMEPAFSPLQMQDDLAEFNRLAQRILTTFEGSGIGKIALSTTNNDSFSGSTPSSAFPSSTGSSTEPPPQKDSHHLSEIRRHALHRAQRIFKWFSKESITIEDLRTCLQGSCTVADIDRFWLAMLQAQRSLRTVRKNSASSIIIQSTLADFIERFYLEVISVSDSLSSMEAAVANLNICCSIICLILLLVFLALLFGDFLAALTSVSSLIFGAAFIFGSSAKNIFESIIFLFVVHPFDIGDRVFISLVGGTGPAPPISMPAGGALFTNASPGSGTLENLVVLQMHLMTTVFERWDGARIYIPNYVLATKPIINVRRSGALFDRHYLQIAFNTPGSALTALKAKISNFLAQERGDYTPQFLLNVEFIENVNKMHLVILVQHRSNWQDLEAQLARRTKLLLFIKEAMEELNISYEPPIQKVELFPTVSNTQFESKEGISSNIV